jgi:TRAP-type C4-dicarboxylate transport system permease small subunit
MLAAPLRATMSVARAACAAAFAAFCALALVQVVNRYLLGLPMFWTEELVLLLFVWSVMLGLPVAIWQREEIVVDIVSFRPGGVAESVRRAAVDLCSASFLVALVWTGLQFVERGGISLSPALGLSRAWFYASIPVGAAVGLVALAGRRLLPPPAPGATAPLTDAAAARD